MVSEHDWVYSGSCEVWFEALLTYMICCSSPRPMHVLLSTSWVVSGGSLQLDSSLRPSAQSWSSFAASAWTLYRSLAGRGRSVALRVPPSGSLGSAGRWSWGKLRLDEVKLRPDGWGWTFSLSCPHKSSCVIWRLCFINHTHVFNSHSQSARRWKRYGLYGLMPDESKRCTLESRWFILYMTLGKYMMKKVTITCTLIVGALMSVLFEYERKVLSDEWISYYFKISWIKCWCI